MHARGSSVNHSGQAALGVQFLTSRYQRGKDAVGRLLETEHRNLGESHSDLLTNQSGVDPPPLLGVAAVVGHTAPSLRHPSR